MRTATLIIRAGGVVMERTKFKEKDFAAKSAGLMKFKAEDKLRRGEQVANFMLKSRKKCLISSKRDIFGNLRRRRRSCESQPI